MGDKKYDTPARAFWVHVNEEANVSTNHQSRAISNVLAVLALHPVRLCMRMCMRTRVCMRMQVKALQGRMVSDTRVKLINELLAGIRVVKMYAWEKAMQVRTHARAHARMHAG